MLGALHPDPSLWVAGLPDRSLVTIAAESTGVSTASLWFTGLPGHLLPLLARKARIIKGSSGK